MDRLGATEERCGEVESSIFDLFAHLGATEEQLDFPVLYASARQVHLLNNGIVTDPGISQLTPYLLAGNKADSVP